MTQPPPWKYTRAARVAARGRREERPLRAPARGRTKMHVDLVRFDEVGIERQVPLGLLRLGAHSDARDVVAGADHPLGQEEAERELEVVPRRPHDDAERRAVERELEWLLRGDLIAIVTPVTRSPSRDLDRRRLG